MFRSIARAALLASVTIAMALTGASLASAAPAKNALQTQCNQLGGTYSKAKNTATCVVVTITSQYFQDFDIIPPYIASWSVTETTTATTTFTQKANGPVVQTYTEKITAIVEPLTCAESNFDTGQDDPLPLSVCNDLGLYPSSTIN